MTQQKRTTVFDGRGGRGRWMACADCGSILIRRSPSQRYCSACSSARDTKRKADWAARTGHRSTPRAYADVQSEKAQAGAAISIDSRSSCMWDADEPVDAHTQVRVAVPFDYAASKNAVWRNGRGGHVYARAEGVAFREGLALMLRHGNHQWYQGKLWIDIFVEKPDHRGDAVNVVDLVCDAVKDATGVDDRWYSIARLDWSIVKESPRLIVGARQAVCEDHQVCSHCGRALPLASSFGRNRSTKTGFARVCRECSAPKRTAKARGRAS